MQLAKAKLQALRCNVNSATAALAAGHMINEEAAENMMWTLQSKARQAHAALQEEQQILYQEGSESDIEEDTCYYVDADFEGLPVKAIKIPGSICQKSNPLVFSHPFAIAPIEITSVTEAGDIMASICSVALFNIGLSRHTQSLVVEKEEQNDLLKEAKELYIESLGLLDQMKSLCPDGSLIQVYLANCNNLVEVYSALGNDEESTNWRETLCQSFWTVPPAKHSPVYRHFLNATECYNIDVLPLPPMEQDADMEE